MNLIYNDSAIKMTCNKIEPGVSEYTFTPSSRNEGIEIQISTQGSSVAYTWHSNKKFDSSLVPGYAQTYKSSINYSAPVLSFYSFSESNVFSVACDELIEDVNIIGGLREDNGVLEINFSAKHLSKENFRVLVIEDDRKYYDALNVISEWWEKELDIFPTIRNQRKPVYSTWYSFHQQLSDQLLMQQFSRMRELGMDTMIIDDGWQTDDCGLGYSYCGDWKIAQSKFSNFKDFVEKAHATKIKIIVWFSVPFVGKMSKKWNEVKTKILFDDNDGQVGLLDIRYRENIDFLIDTYIDFVKKYNIDGMKLDFIDSLVYNERNKPWNEKMEFKTLAEALFHFLSELKKKILKINPNFFIEFRQKYVGPMMRNYSNAFRVEDCPLSAITNRVGITDMRLLSGTTPIHSDMLMWNEDETPEYIAMNLASTIFGVTQVSVDLNKLSEEQMNTLKFYFKFGQKYCFLLQEAQIKPSSPQLEYPIIRASDEKTEMIANYFGETVLELTKKTSIVVNANMLNNLYLKNPQNFDYKITIYDCQGKLKEEKIKNEQLINIQQFHGGITKIEQVF